MAAETGFLINGKIYELPTLESMTLDESEVMYERCGIVQEDFVKEADESEDEHTERVAKLLRHPGFMGSLMQIAYQRGNPDKKPAQVRAVLGKTNRLEAFSTLADVVQEAVDDVPLALTSEPSEASSSGSLESENSLMGSHETSGNGSTNGSEIQAGEAVTTGITRSDTSSISGLQTSAA